MGFTLGFVVGVFWGILTTFAAIGLGMALKDSRRRQEAIGRVRTGLRVYWKTKRHVDVLPDPKMLVDIRKEESLVN